MRQKHLESALCNVQRVFPEPNVTLEQYPTSPHLAAAVALMALEKGDLGPGRSALDLGCGTGILSMAAALLKTDHVVGLDCDEAALQVAAENAVSMELDETVCLVLARVKDVVEKKNQHNSSSSNIKGKRGSGRGGRNSSRGRGGGRGSSGGQQRRSTPEARQLILSDDDGIPFRSNCVDTVLTNPPFGTKNNAGMDLRFLRTATRLARRAVYSFHKTSTRDFLVRQVESWDMEVQVLAEMKFDLPKTYSFHKEKSTDVHVDLIRVLVSVDEKDKDEEQVGQPGSDDEDNGVDGT